MHVHWLQHAEFEDLGCMGPWLEQYAQRLTHTPLHAGAAPPDSADFDWLIVLGGPMNIDEHERYPWLLAEKRLIAAALQAGKRVLGLCLGAQLIASQLGGAVTRNRETELGWFPVTLTEAGCNEPLLAGFPASFMPFHWHGDTYALPRGATRLAASEACSEQAFVWQRRVLGLQFHLEVTADRAARWFEQEQIEPARWVQPPAAILSQRQNFEHANKLLIGLLERMAAMS